MLENKFPTFFQKPCSRKLSTLSRPAGLAILSLAADYWRKWIDPQGDIGVYGTFGRHHSMAMDQRIKAMVKRNNDNMSMDKRSDKMLMDK